MVGLESLQSTLCQRVCYPRLLLRCASLREVLTAKHGKRPPSGILELSRAAPCSSVAHKRLYYYLSWGQGIM
jgi:hypothetical protein